MSNSTTGIFYFDKRLLTFSFRKMITLVKTIMKYALITGACSGLARAIIKSIKDDFFIFAVDINPDIFKLYEHEDSIRAFTCDIAEEAKLLTVKNDIEKLTTSLDLLINFAGIVELGSLIEVPPAKFERSMCVNVIGNYHVTHAFFPLIKNGKGRIIVLSSEYGKLLGLPFHSFYTISKHALEIYADSLRREVKGLGIKVVTIRPGSFKTAMVDNIERQFKKLVDDTVLFKKPLSRMESMMKEEIKSASKPQKIIRTFHKAIYKKNPKIAYRVHNSLKMKLLNILPPQLQDWILSHFF